MRFLRETQIDFMKYRKGAFILSCLVILAGIIAFLLHGQDNFGIDFTGGTLVRYKFAQKVSIGEIRQALVKKGLGDSVIQSFDFEQDQGILIRTRGKKREEIESTINTAFASSLPQILEEKTVGPVVGDLLKRQALKAIIFALLGILIYIAWRFEFRFASAAVICLFHDVLITVGVFALTQREISLPVIAALLTIVGYSLNDTIVVFDQIRENLKAGGRKDFPSIINSSINQVLSRTLVTSLTTLLVVLSLLFLGGAVIQDFAFALAIGIVVGTYSSIYIASPLLATWEKLKKSKT